jgi:hypothetical protein
MSDLYAKKCAGKKRHESERKAEDWAKKTKRETGFPMRAYFCPFCRSWHVGNALYANGRAQRMERMEATQ